MPSHLLQGRGESWIARFTEYFKYGAALGHRFELTPRDPKAKRFECERRPEDNVVEHVGADGMPRNIEHARRVVIGMQEMAHALPNREGATDGKEN